MKNIVKVLILLLALCMIVPCIAACNDNKTPTHQTPPPDDDTTTTPGEGGNGGGDNGNDDGGKEEQTTPDPFGGVIMPEKMDLGGVSFFAECAD